MWEKESCVSIPYRFCFYLFWNHFALFTSFFGKLYNSQWNLKNRSKQTKILIIFVLFVNFCSLKFFILYTSDSFYRNNANMNHLLYSTNNFVEDHMCSRSSMLPMQSISFGMPNERTLALNEMQTFTGVKVDSTNARITSQHTVDDTQSRKGRFAWEKINMGDIFIPVIFR